MLASGFTAAPVSKLLMFGNIASSIIVSITDTKYLFHIQAVPHLWTYKQVWRLWTWQLSYSNSTELLFASMLIYHLRIIERLWGSRKFSTFLISCFVPTTLLAPILLLLLRALSFNSINHLPAGPTPLIFALLAQYHAAIPTMYKYRIVTSPATDPSSTQDPSGLVFSDKSMTYLLAAQLALSAVPGSMLAATVGWLVGTAWRGEWGPAVWGQWRVPSWVVGEQKREKREGFEGLRRRMEGEGRASGTGADIGERGARRRGMLRGMVDQFRGAF